MDNKNLIFKTMDNSPRVLFWRIDEFIIMVAPFFLGALVSSVILMLSGFVLKKFYSRYIKQFPKGALMHILYWNMPTKAFRRAGIFKRLPQSHKRDFLT